jgi:hypothetical protein
MQKEKTTIQEAAAAAMAQAKAAQAAVLAVSQASKPPAKRKSGAKTKDALNVPKHHVITWVPADFPPDEHTRLVKVAKQRNTNLDKLLHSLIAEQLVARKAEFDKDVVEFDAKVPPMTLEQLEKQLAKAQATQAALTAQLAKVRAAR